MTFDELKNGMKSLFFSLGAKTSDSNYGVALLDKTSGEPKGLMGMSDLASVLGGLFDGAISDFNNNNYDSGMHIYSTDAASNPPLNMSTYGILVSFLNLYYGFQIYCPSGGDPIIRSFSKNRNTGVCSFNSWKTMV